MVTTEQHERRFLLAAAIARASLCLRSRCGAVLYVGNDVVGMGCNGPPNNDTRHRKCGETVPSKGKPKSDRTCCLHAEWRALFDGLRNHPPGLRGASLYFARVDGDGQLKKSGKPYCTVCSRLALEFDVHTWVLWHPEGIRIYDATEYNELSHRYDDES